MVNDSWPRWKFWRFKSNMYVKVEDGKISVYNGQYGVHIELEDNRIKKSDLNFMLVSGWFNVEGNWKITGYPASHKIPELGKLGGRVAQIDLKYQLA